MSYEYHRTRDSLTGTETYGCMGKITGYLFFAHFSF
jgi:hypothetical protein